LSESLEIHSRVSAESGGWTTATPHREIARLKEINRRLEIDCEQLRGVFDMATDQFNSIQKQLEELKRELEDEKAWRKELAKRNEQLERELRDERAKANKFADMLFGLKSEKLKLSDIKVVDENTIRIDEPEKTAPVGGGKTEKKPSKKKGGQPGHEGNGRKLPEGLPIVERIIALPEGEIIHGIPAADWLEQPGMDEQSYIIRKKVIWYIEQENLQATRRQ
jgi:myosin heavy subunit